MGLRSPQSLNTVKIQAQPGVRFQGAVAPKIGTEFLTKLSKDLDAKEAARIELEKKRAAEKLKFVKADAANYLDSVRIDAQAIVSTTDGIPSQEVAKKQRERLQKAADKRLDETPEEYRPYIQQEVGKVLNQFDTHAVPHVYGQYKKVEDNTFKTRPLNDMNSAIESSADLEAFNVNLDTVVGEQAVTVARRMYGDSDEQAEMVETARVKAISETVRRAVEQQARLGDAGMAKAGQILSTLNNRLTPEDRVKAIKMLKAAEEDNGTRDALALSEQAAKNFPDDLMRQDEWIKLQAKNDSVARQATAFMSNRATLVEKQKRLTIENSYATLNRNVQDGRPLDPEALNALPFKERTEFLNTLNKNGGGFPVVTDQDALLELDRKISDAVVAGDLPKYLIDQYRHKISRKDLAPHENRYNMLRSEENKQFQRVHRAGDKLVSDILANHFKTPELRGKTKLQADVTNYTRNLVNSLIEENPRMNERTLRQKVQSALIERSTRKVKVPSWYGNLAGSLNSDWADWGESERTEANPDLAKTGGPDVHPSLPAAIKARAKQRGRELTDTQVQALIQTMIKNKMDVSRPR